MPEFKFSTPVVVRYADIDAQGHVNHARYFTFMEEGRRGYMQTLGLWTDMRDFNGVGQIVAEASCTYLQSIHLGQTVDVAVRVARLGAKSLVLEYQLSVQGQTAAQGRTVQVAYDYVTRQSTPVPPAWRQAILDFEPDLSNPPST